MVDARIFFCLNYFKLVVGFQILVTTHLKMTQTKQFLKVCAPRRLELFLLRYYHLLHSSHDLGNFFVFVLLMILCALIDLLRFPQSSFLLKPILIWQSLLKPDANWTTSNKFCNPQNKISYFLKYPTSLVHLHWFQTRSQINRFGSYFQRHCLQTFMTAHWKHTSSALQHV